MMKNKSIKLLYRICFVTAFAMILLGPLASLAADQPGDKKGTDKVRIVVEKSQILPVKHPPKRVYVVDPKIARIDEKALRETGTVLLTGVAPGTTNLAVWQNDGDKDPVLFEVEVVHDKYRLKQQLHAMFPQEKNLQVTTAADCLTLSGTVSSAAVLSQVLELAKAYAPAEKDGKSKLINLLEVGGVQQVMLEVRVSEMSRNLGRRLGINAGTVSSTAQQFGVSLLGGLSNVTSTEGYTLEQRLPISKDILSVLSKEAGYPVAPLGVSNQVNMILRFLGGGASWTVFIDALKENGLLKVLAEPTLITLSGKEAKFLAGGEFPIPVPGEEGAVTIQYKAFGVGLAFTPTVLGDGKISMQVAPEVSDLDYSNAVALQGFLVPGITTRRVATHVELADGQSFAIAGLLKEDVRETVKKFPLLGDIPILGALFKSSSFQKKESELVIVVTPRLVKPVDMKKQTLPTDQFVEPNDLEFYLLGALEGNGPVKAAGSAVPAPTKQGALEGKFGHITPK